MSRRPITSRSWQQWRTCPRRWRGRLPQRGGRPYPDLLVLRAPKQERGPVRTFSPKSTDIQRAWHVIDADGLVLGRLSTEVARLLRGKHKPTFAPHMDTGDFVIAANPSKIAMPANRAEKTVLYRHPGYPGGIRSQTYRELI